MIGNAWTCHFSIEWSIMDLVDPFALAGVNRQTKWTDPRAAYAAVCSASGQRNLDPALLLVPGEKIVDAARTHVRSMCGIDRYIFNLGHGAMPKKPPNTVKAVLDAVQRGS